MNSVQVTEAYRRILFTGILERLYWFYALCSADFSVMCQELLITPIPFAKYKSFISHNSTAVPNRQRDINNNKKDRRRKRLAPSSGLVVCGQLSMTQCGFISNARYSLNDYGVDLCFDLLPCKQKNTDFMWPFIMVFVQKEKWLIYLTAIYTHSEYVSGEHIRLTIW